MERPSLERLLLSAGGETGNIPLATITTITTPILITSLAFVWEYTHTSNVPANSNFILIFLRRAVFFVQRLTSFSYEEMIKEKMSPTHKKKASYSFLSIPLVGEKK